MARVKQKLLDQFTEYSWILFDNINDLDSLFKSEERKIILEVWCGNWNFFVDLVKNNPDFFCIWCDQRKDRLVKALKKINNVSCCEKQWQFSPSDNVTENVKSPFSLFAWDWKELIKVFWDKSIQKLYLNFPDPHPRKKEWKYRFFMPEIITLLKEKITSDWEIQIRTDDYDYFIFTRTVFYLFRKDFQETFFSLDVHFDRNIEKCKEFISHNYIITEFEEKWLAKGKKIYQVNYKKKS